MKKHPQDPTLLIHGVCAVIWTVLAAFKISQYSQGDPIFLPILYTLCALLWIVVFAKRWWNNRSKQQDNSNTKQRGDTP